MAVMPESISARYTCVWSFQGYSWIQDFEAEFPKKVDLNLVLNLADYLASDLVSVYPKTIDHFNMNLLLFCRYTASFKDLYF